MFNLKVSKLYIFILFVDSFAARTIRIPVWFRTIDYIRFLRLQCRASFSVESVIHIADPDPNLNRDPDLAELWEKKSGNVKKSFLAELFHINNGIKTFTKYIQTNPSAFHI